MKESIRSEKEVFSNGAIEKIGQNLKYDLHILKNYELDVKGRLFDTMVADHLIDAHIKNANGMEELVKNWSTDSKGLGLEIASVHRDVALCIDVIKELLKEKPKEKKIVKSHS